MHLQLLSTWPRLGKIRCARMQETRLGGEGGFTGGRSRARCLARLYRPDSCRSQHPEQVAAVQRSAQKVS